MSFRHLHPHDELGFESMAKNAYPAISWDQACQTVMAAQKEQQRQEQERLRQLELQRQEQKRLRQLELQRQEQERQEKERLRQLLLPPECPYCRCTHMVTYFDSGSQVSKFTCGCCQD